MISGPKARTLGPLPLTKKTESGISTVPNNDNFFRKDGLNPMKKNLFLTGPVGCGKSTTASLLPLLTNLPEREAF